MKKPIQSLDESLSTITPKNDQDKIFKSFFNSLPYGFIGTFHLAQRKHDQHLPYSIMKEATNPRWPYLPLAGPSTLNFRKLTRGD